MPFEELREIPVNVEDFAKTVDGQAVEPEKTPLELRYDELYAKYLGQLERPKKDMEFEFKLWDGTMVKGKLAEITPARAVIALKYGTMTYPVDRIHPRYYATLFPERAAHHKALRELRKEVREKREAEIAAAQPAAPAKPAAGDKPSAQPGRATDHGTKVAGGPATARPEDPTAQPSQPVVRNPYIPEQRTEEQLAATTGSNPEYDPSPGKTPGRLRPAITAFGQWLNYQHRRVGGKIADKIYAKQHGQHPVVYCVMNPSFADQDYDVRYQIAEGMWQFWGLRCQSSGVVGDPNHTHIVLIDSNNKIIGGSSPQDGARIWVAKKGIGNLARR